MEQFEAFFSKYPNIASLLIRLLATGLIIVAMAYFRVALVNSTATLSVAVENNTAALKGQKRALEEVVSVVNEVKDQVADNKLALREYAVRLNHLEKR